jgi:ankyrin repeat protein
MVSSMTGIVKILFEFGADINLQNRFNNTALVFACLKSHIDIVKLLLKSGAVNLQNKDGDTALIRASVHNHIDAVKLLIKFNIDINTQNKNKQSEFLEFFLDKLNEISISDTSSMKVMGSCLSELTRQSDFVSTKIAVIIIKTQVFILKGKS